MNYEYAIGIEEEYQLLDPATGELRARAEAVLEGEWSPPELLEETSSFEIATRWCSSANLLADELRRVRLRAAIAAKQEELALVASGLYPFRVSRPLSPGARDARIHKHYGRVVQSEQLFDMRIQVAVPYGVDRARLLGGLREYGALVLALTASSPFFEGRDTGYASFRAIQWRVLPFAGPPPCFGSEAEYSSCVDRLLQTGAIFDRGGAQWSVRLHPVEHALEFCIADVCPRLADAVAIGSLVRALVVGLAEGFLSSNGEGVSEAKRYSALLANEWQAARHGLKAVFWSPTKESGTDQACDTLRRLIDHLGPVSAQIGDVDELTHLETLIRQGNGADRARQALAVPLHPEAAVPWLSEEALRGVGLEH